MPLGHSALSASGSHLSSKVGRGPICRSLGSPCLSSTGGCREGGAGTNRGQPGATSFLLWLACSWAGPSPGQLCWWGSRFCGPPAQRTPPSSAWLFQGLLRPLLPGLPPTPHHQQVPPPVRGQRGSELDGQRLTGAPALSLGKLCSDPSFWGGEGQAGTQRGTQTPFLADCGEQRVWAGQLGRRLCPVSRDRCSRRCLSFCPLSPWEGGGGAHSADGEGEALAPAGSPPLDGQHLAVGLGVAGTYLPSRLCPGPQCSTTCGLGAVWRPVHCSSGREEDCVPASRPQPARRCRLRPCAAWHTGNWSKVRGGLGVQAGPARPPVQAGGGSVPLSSGSSRCVLTSPCREPLGCWLRPFLCTCPPPCPGFHRPRRSLVPPCPPVPCGGCPWPRICGPRLAGSPGRGWRGSVCCCPATPRGAVRVWGLLTPCPWPAVLPQLWGRVLRAGRAVRGHTGPPAAAALPLPAGACHATHPPSLRGAALPQLVHLFLEGGEAWGPREGVGGVLRPWPCPDPSPCPSHPSSALRLAVGASSTVW